MSNTPTSKKNSQEIAGIKIEIQKSDTRENIVTPPD